MIAVMFAVLAGATMVRMLQYRSEARFYRDLADEWRRDSARWEQRFYDATGHGDG